MTEMELKNLVSKIHSSQAEFQTVEVKRAQTGVPEILYDTLSSFSNQNDGGVIVFGLYEVMGITENRYSGIPTIRREMKEAKHPVPEFSAIHGEFCVCLKNQIVTLPDSTDRKTDILNFCKIPRSKKEIADYLGVSSVSYGIKKNVMPLVEQGLLEMSNPKSPGSRSQKFTTV